MANGLGGGFDMFVLELLGDSGFSESAVEINRAFTALDIEADGNLDAERLFSAVMWICNQRQQPLHARMEKISRLAALRGKVSVNLREFTGW
jgi:hypothetical protein